MIGQPGSLPLDGDKIDVDTDRELPEITAEIQGASTRVIVDTGDSREMLVFKSFVDEHPGLVSLAILGPTLNRGIGGSVDTVGTIVNVLQIGPYRLFNRYADVVLSTTGAFADRNDGGNVGYGSLRNFVVTFDLADHALYLQKAQGFDDGHDRRVSLNNNPVTNRRCPVDRVRRRCGHDDASNSALVFSPHPLRLSIAARCRRRGTRLCTCAGNRAQLIREPPRARVRRRQPLNARIAE